MLACWGKVEYCPSPIHNGMVPVPATALPTHLQLKLGVSMVIASVQGDGTPKATMMQIAEGLQSTSESFRARTGLHVYPPRLLSLELIFHSLSFPTQPPLGAAGKGLRKVPPRTQLTQR